jgi:hypothetical protein
MTAASDPADPAPASPDEPVAAQFGPHRFYAGEGGGSEQFRGARFDVADLRGSRFPDCDLTGVTIRDGWLVNVSISGYLSNVTVNGVDVTDFVSAELDRRHPERVQFREGQTASRAAARGSADSAGQRGVVIRADTAPSGGGRDRAWHRPERAARLRRDHGCPRRPDGRDAAHRDGSDR